MNASDEMKKLSQPIYLPVLKYYKGILLGIFTKKDGKYYWAGCEVTRGKEK